MYSKDKISYNYIGWNSMQSGPGMALVYLFMFRYNAMMTFNLACVRGGSSGS